MRCIPLLYDINSIGDRLQFEEAETPADTVAVHKDHDVTGGLVYAQILAGIVGPILSIHPLVQLVALK